MQRETKKTKLLCIIKDASIAFFCHKRGEVNGLARERGKRMSIIKNRGGMTNNNVGWGFVEGRAFQE